MIYVGVSPWCEEPIVSKTGHDGFAYVEKWLRVSQMSEMIIQSEMMFETVYQRVNDRCYWEDYISSELLCLRSMWHFFQTISSEDPKGGTLPDHTYPRCSSIFLHGVIQRISRLSLATFCPMRWWSWLSSWTTQPGPSIFSPLGWIWQCIVGVAIEVTCLGSGSLPLHGLFAMLCCFDDPTKHDQNIWLGAFFGQPVPWIAWD